MRNDPRTPRDYAHATKDALRLGMALHGVSAADLARAIGEHEHLVEAWRSDTKANHVPAWPWSHPACPPALKAHMLAHFGTEEPEGACAHTAEAQANVATGSVGAVPPARSAR